MAKMTKKSHFVGLLLLLLLSLMVMASGDTLQDECSKEFTKVTACLAFATGKAAAPTKECCGAVTEIKEDDPACLCFIIQQIHNGTNPALKSMGIQEAKLLQLPSACSLANASVSNCPKLLHLPPNSTEAAIFTNPTTATPTPSTSTPGTSSSTTMPAGSNGFKHVPGLGGSTLLAAAIFLFFLFFSAFPSGTGSRLLY